MLAFLFIFLLPTKGKADYLAKGNEEYHILILQSYAEDLAVYTRYNKLIDRHLRDSGIQAKYKTFYLDSEHHSMEKSKTLLHNFLDSMKWVPDIILSNDDEVTCALMECDHPLSTSIPVIFAGVNFPNWEMIHAHPNMTGFWDKPDYITTIKLIEQLYGKDSRVLTFRDNRTIAMQAFTQLAEEADTFDISLYKGFYAPTPDSTLQILHSGNKEKPSIYAARIKDISASHLLRLFEDKPYTACLQLILDFDLLTLGRLANVPSFTVINIGFNDDKGITGGYFTTLQLQTQGMATLATRILKGTSVESIPITESPKVYAFDWKELQRFNIKTDRLPSGSIIYNLPPEIQYQSYIIAGAILLVLIFFYIIGHLIFMYRRESERKKQAQLNLIAEKNRAEEANRMKSVFLANMSHEIRTPLNAIVGFSNLMQDDKDLEEEEKELFRETINKNSTLLLKLINDILELSRIESGRLSFTFDDCPLNQLLEEVYQTHSVLIPPTIRFLKDIPHTKIKVHVDSFRFTQVITNFINNAVKFTAKGYIKLSYVYKEEEGKVYISVEDTGKGMSKETQKKVFERFYKDNEFAQGTGLGLSICKMIAERLAGDILLTSEEGKGSRFTLVIPGTLM